MALPYLIKHIYNTGTDEVIRRGKKIHSLRNVEMAGHDDLMNSVNFRVKDDVYGTYYKVSIQKYDDPRQMQLKCSCAYNLSEICRHEAAALMQLQDLLDKNLLNATSQKIYNQKHTVAKIKFIDLKMIRMLAGPENFEDAERLLQQGKCAIISAANERVEGEINDERNLYKIILQKNEGQYFDTSCTCDEEHYVLCRHKTALFLQLLNNYGAGYFDTIKNWDRQKNKLLEGYGFSLDDNLEGKFEFVYKEGKPFLRVLDSSLKRINMPLSPMPQVHIAEKEEPAALTIQSSTRKELSLVLNSNEKSFPFLSFDTVQGNYDEESNAFTGNLELIDLHKYFNAEKLSESDRQFLHQVRKIQSAEINKYLNRNSPFSGFWENIIQQETDELPEETRILITEYLHPKLKKILALFENIPFFHLPKNKKFLSKNLVELEASEKFPRIFFEVSIQENQVILESFVKIDALTIPVSDNEWSSNLMFLYNDVVYTWESFEQALVAEKFRQPIIFPPGEWPKMLHDLIIPLTKEYEVNFEKSLIRDVKDGDPAVSVQLVEKGDFLLFQPVFSYKGFNIRPTDKATVIVPDNDKVLLIHRNPEAEENFIRSLENLHSHFSRQAQYNGLALKGAEVLKNNWFFLFVDAMNEMKVPVYGFEALKNFRFNTARPSTRIKLSSGMDWFDAKVELSFGDQQIGISEIQKALANKQSFVQLSDGSLGVLPEEWIKKYALLFKLGEGKHDQLRLSKFHLSVIDDLYEKRNEEELIFDLDEKYERLRQFKNIPEIAIPAGLEQHLRPYQLAGFHWLNYLNQVGWGGILADDMGLGKTAQGLTMLLHQKNETGSLKALVVCPTTLIYNWENEIGKFAPSLTFHIHHGSTRLKDIASLQEHNIVITTYGTLRSDIQMLMKSPFDYVVLDESQAIKNPFSKVTKAACLLKAQHKLCMSGTPLQNNTFDLYAQMNFLNPGLLGSIEFFRNEFSTPIDKMGEQEQKDHLKKLLFPFVLRRTKEQVAKDLPEKTETVLFCEMEDKQRAIYEAYRNSYREKILGTIDEQGVGKSQLTILQGLMKLRQICDSPAILNEEEKYPNESIKLDELSRELTENIGEHKALVFSQFLGMLALIREQLEKNNIEYEYFDGSTLPADRERAIQNFQSNDNCRVFLISLKAGGVGLNLTAADYVYIVDPWWNPAVEQQAIDRTHRIGQTKNIFAYRMICKDTIEDKILKLQERKRILAKELISDDKAFVKSLTREDVEYLFN